MIPDLRQYRLEYPSDIDAYIRAGGEAFREYYRAFREFARQMPENSLFDICREIPDEHLPRFARTAMVYIAKEREECIVFTDDYRQLRKLPRSHWDTSSSKKPTKCPRNNAK